MMKQFFKTKRTRCFYFSCEGEDYTATLCGRLEAERVFNWIEVDSTVSKKYYWYDH